MIMFGSNSYLGLANPPYVKERVQQAVQKYGVGIGGPPLLIGYTVLHRELEERLALKGAEDAMIFPAGYSANVGLVTGLVNPTDTVLYDVSREPRGLNLKVGSLFQSPFRRPSMAMRYGRMQKTTGLF